MNSMTCRWRHILFFSQAGLIYMFLEIENVVIRVSMNHWSSLSREIVFPVF